MADYHEVIEKETHYMSFFFKNKYIKKNLTFLVLVFKIKHLFIRSNNLPGRNVSKFK